MVLYKALARERDKRYQTAEELWDALNSILFTFGMKVGNKEIAALVNKVIENKEEKYEDLSSFNEEFTFDDDFLTKNETSSKSSD